MPPFADWFPPTAVGLTFTLFGGLKVYGRTCGIIGGGGKPASQRICGSCPTWTRGWNIAFVCLFLAIGLGNLAYAAWVFLRK